MLRWLALREWTRVDRYFACLLPRDATLEAAQRHADAAGLPQHQVADNQGRFLALIAKMNGAKRALEIGTLAGYSTIWLARAVDHVTTLELDAMRARVAEENFARAGVSNRVRVMIGPALESLTALRGEIFDVVFIDADKQHNRAYFEAALALSAPGTVLVVDNVVRDGRVTDANSTDPSVQGVRSLVAYLANEPRVEATAVQTVGEKGYDGFLLARVL